MTDSANSQMGAPFSGVPEVQVLGKARNGDWDAILELGRRSSPESLRQLSELAATSIPPVEIVKRETSGIAHQDKERMAHLSFIFGMRSLYAKAALAKRGDEGAFADILRGLPTVDGETFHTSMGLLGYVGNAKAIPYVAPYLFKSGTPYKLPPDGHAWTANYPEIAADTLGRLLPEVQKQLKESNPGNYYLTAPWKDWWKKNEAAYGGGVEPTRP